MIMFEYNEFYDVHVNCVFLSSGVEMDEMVTVWWSRFVVKMGYFYTRIK